MKHIVIVIISFVLICGLIIFLCTQNIGLIFSKTVNVANIVQLENCKEGDYIILEFSTAYLTDYIYEENGRFIDVDINGKALICVVDNEIVSKIENQENNTIKIEGVLKNLNEEDGVKSIKQNYIEDFQWELSEEEVLDMFTDLQLLSYNTLKPNYIVILFCILLILGLFVLAIYNIISLRNQK